jgi:cholest-4-en-3-one 26-monooxygenase
MAPIDVDLSSPDTFVPGVPHEAFRRLRREAPVFWQESCQEGANGFWSITRYQDLKAISKNPALFSSARGGVNLRTPDDEMLARLRHIMLYMDPPQHRRYRGIVNKAFTPRMVQQLLPSVRRLAREIVDDVAQKGEADFVNEIAARLPMAVICEMMGVEEEDRLPIYDLSNRMVGSDDPDFSADQEEAIQANLAMFQYAAKVAERARRKPGDDLATALLRAEVDGERLSELDFNSFFLLLCVAGNETTRTVTCNGMHALLQNRDQMRLLQQDPKLIPSGVEEMLRYEPAVMHFRRTATEDVELRGERIRAGDAVVLWYPSVNRDEEVFQDPDRFDVRRDPNDHLAFGVGEHYCLGANLARMELVVMFEELLGRLPDLELAGPVRRLRSNFINGIKQMPVRFRPGDAG